MGRGGVGEWESGGSTNISRSILKHAVPTNFNSLCPACGLSGVGGLSSKYDPAKSEWISSYNTFGS